MLGVISQQGGNSSQALEWFDAALTAKPDFLQARYNRSVVLRAMGRNEEALQSARAILKTSPDFAIAWDMAGQILKDAGDFAEAAKCYAHALALEPGNAQFHGNFAVLLFAQEDLQAAFHSAKKAESLDPAFPPMLIGNILRSWGYPEKAAACFRRVREIIPNFPDAYASEAMARLQMGDFREGFALWEKRPDLSSDKEKGPLWAGQKTTSLGLYEDQGLGDAIQFLRYVPAVRTLAKSVTLRVREPLVDLCRSNFPDIDVVSEKDRSPATEYRCRLSSLPFFFQIDKDNISDQPYLAPTGKSGWKEKLGALPRPLVGVVWAGNASFKNDAQRSIAFGTFKDLFSCGHKHFVSIQKDRADLTSDLVGYDAGPELGSFADTAELISELDMVISVDTATAHLAGALGKPVYVLLPFNADWRWLIEREDSLWYKSARLFRQKKPDDWEGVIATVRSEAEKFINGDTSVLSARKWSGTYLRQNPFAIPIPD